MRILHRMIWLVLVLACSAADSAGADERILRYHSDLTVNQDGSMDVVETITVRAEGNKIRRGIFRDFPTDYTDRLDNRVRVGFDIRYVRRDGKAEPYHTERLANGVRVYVGSANIYLNPNTYAYEIHYRTTRMLGFFADRDELYWNVTGNGWDFPIDEASAAVRLPAGIAADRIRVEGFTGQFGSTEQAYRAQVGSDGTVEIQATRPLLAQEGLSLVTSWPKGHVTEPTSIDNLVFLLRQNRGLLIALCSSLGTVFFLVLAWRGVGVDPPPGVVFPQYEPPNGYSPASLRYVSKMRYDKHTLAAAILNLAVRKFITIEKTGAVYSLKRTDKKAEYALAPGEGVLLSRLFGKRRSLLLDEDNHKIIGAARKAHKVTLRRYHHKRYFFDNVGYLAPAVVLLVGALAATRMLDELTPAVVITLAAGAGAVLLFSWLLKAPTARGRKLLDQVAGFRQYLEFAEREDLDLRNPPEKTPQLFERYLPYALALGVEQPWAEQFVTVFRDIDKDQGRAYRPDWYAGDWNSSSPVRFANTVGDSLSSAIASAATPPGSSGGGFSGGGGGGGGGGGW